MHLRHIVDAKMIRLVHDDNRKLEIGLWKARPLSQRNLSHQQTTPTTYDRFNRLVSLKLLQRQKIDAGFGRSLIECRSSRMIAAMHRAARKRWRNLKRGRGWLANFSVATPMLDVVT
jgi:hypothetical protein